jgi:hypothetical protein
MNIKKSFHQYVLIENILKLTEERSQEEALNIFE